MYTSQNHQDEDINPVIKLTAYIKLFSKYMLRNVKNIIKNKAD